MRFINICYVYYNKDDEIKKIVKEILDKANLEEITMKTVCRHVYSKYPDFDLSHKKEFIKTTVKSVSVKRRKTKLIYIKLSIFQF